MKEGNKITTNSPVIYVISDSLGETAEMVARAVASQFNSGNMEIKRFPYVNDTEQIEDIVEEAAEHDAVIAYTLVLPELKEKLREVTSEKGIPAVDIIGPMLSAVEGIVSVPPKMEPGLLRKLDEQYFRKVEAIEFAVKYDDGKDPRGLIFADIVLIGVSRTSKTPVSMYLAHKRIKTANVPLVPEVAPPDELFRVGKKTVGLTIDPDLLFQIRQQRLKSLGLTSKANYANMERILQELEYSREIMSRLGCPVVDVTNKAVEETASKIMEIFFKGESYD
ncbi:MAG: [pyruvate, water dikinase]-phosphate phosphotransferase / [pyruvate, water dikinase] kinase [Clostridia bacterium]|nr:[pyruvate, water dikinase]-phosphate phosphotransferase / [pyruvate, water dikinase] kinase [Clostridia bacterium]